MASASECAGLSEELSNAHENANRLKQMLILSKKRVAEAEGELEEKAKEVGRLELQLGELRHQKEVLQKRIKKLIASWKKR